MQQYNISRSLSPDCCTDDLSNALALRADIHRIFDEARFVIVPKENTWVAHFLQITHSLGYLYHNTAPGLAISVSTEALLTRFAWAIFQSVMLVQGGGGKRRLRIKTIEDGEIVERIQDMNVNTYQNTLRACGQSRSRSPRKRPAPSESEPSTVETVLSLGIDASAEVRQERAGAKRRLSSSSTNLHSKRVHVEDATRDE